MDLAVPPSLLALVDELEAKRVIYSPLVCLNLWPYYGLIYFLGGGWLLGGGYLGFPWIVWSIFCMLYKVICDSMSYMTGVIYFMLFFCFIDSFWRIYCALQFGKDLFLPFLRIQTYQSPNEATRSDLNFLIFSYPGGRKHQQSFCQHILTSPREKWEELYGCGWKACC